MSTKTAKCCSATLKGKRPEDEVQDVGFRGIIEAIGIIHGISGMVFNYPDGSVTVYCAGDNKSISNFFKDILSKASERGIGLDVVDKKELPPDCRLPVKFLKLDTDDKVDLGRKLDKGNDFLRDIKGDTSNIREGISAIKEDTSALPEIKDTLGSFVVEQREHNKRLEKILEKLAER